MELLGSGCNEFTFDPSTIVPRNALRSDSPSRCSFRRDGCKNGETAKLCRDISIEKLCAYSVSLRSLLADDFTIALLMTNYLER